MADDNIPGSVGLRDEGWQPSIQEMEIRELRKRVSSLEERLAEYHHWLERSTEFDRKFLLKATWGIVIGLGNVMATLIAIWISTNLFEAAWAQGVSVVVIWLIAAVLIATYNEKGLRKDNHKLSRLPQWGPQITARESEWDL